MVLALFRVRQYVESVRFLICKHAVDAFAGMMNKWKGGWIRMDANDVRIVYVTA